MSTTIQRISVTLNAEALETVKALAKKAKTYVSKICSRLVANQLENDEDAYWMKIVEEEKAKGFKTLGHEEFWSRVDLQDLI